LVRTTNTVTFNESSIATLTNFYNKTDANNLLNAKQNTLTFKAVLSGIGSNLTLVNYADIIGLPNNFQSDWNSTVRLSTFPANMTDIYTKTETDNLFYAKRSSINISKSIN
jgi:hypothetical protein